MIIFKSKSSVEKGKHTDYVRRMLYEGQEYDSLDDAKADIVYRLKRTFPRAVLESKITPSTKLVP
jgi:hypothetical protein